MSGSLFAALPCELWTKLVLRIRSSDDAGLIALLDQAVAQTAIVPLERKPPIPASAPIPWGQT